jgi:hypothetical protein
LEFSEDGPRREIEGWGVKGTKRGGTRAGKESLEIRRQAEEDMRGVYLRSTLEVQTLPPPSPQASPLIVANETL